ncbi:MAG: metallophosphoesterase [Chloroflexota bacterium]|nr:metallophosphoesterase [Chloroflexota bacterium]
MAGSPPQVSSAASSRESRDAAGWHCEAVGTYQQLIPGKSRFSWLDPRPLIQSRNDRLARRFGDPVNDIRRAWVARQRERERVPEDLTIRDHAQKERVSFVLIGDTGEGDGSQYALVPALMRRASDTDFLVILSDVIYPAGGVGEYLNKFYWPYASYPAPIYAIPGNHDWYDDLVAFMVHFCRIGVEERSPAVRGPGNTWRRFVRNSLWRRPRRWETAGDIARMRALRPRPEQQGSQPGPYFALDTGPLLLVGIDPGITSEIDRDQAEWLWRVSRSAKPKILLTGKPIYVDGKYEPSRIEGMAHETVDDVVRDPECNYVAAVGGDVHNYQRYPVHLPDGRIVQYLVSGGGGAYTHATHKIPNIDSTPLADRTSEQEYRCYPLRGDSLSMFSRLYDRKLRFRDGESVEIPVGEASRLMAERLGLTPTRSHDVAAEVSERSRRAFERVFPQRTRGRAALHHYFSELLDWNEPPMFKSFVRIDATPDEVRLTCYSATGCREQELDPPVEDAVRATSGADGHWSWENLK